MKLIPNWAQVLKHAWSIWAMTLAIVVQIADALPMIGDILPRWSILLILALGIVGRLIKQKGLSE